MLRKTLRWDHDSRTVMFKYGIDQIQNQAVQKKDNNFLVKNIKKSLEGVIKISPPHACARVNETKLLLIFNKDKTSM